MRTEDILRAFIVDELGFAGAARDLTDDLELIEAKVLDSLGIFQLVTYIEEECGIEVRDEELLPANFSTIASLAAFVDSKRAA